ncbi:MAG: DUF6353 family protein [Bacillota bacterium]
MNKYVKQFQRAVKHHSPEILTGIGIAGMITTTVMAVQATPKALQLLDAKKEELDVEELEVKDMVQATWRCYVPAVIVGVSTIACLVNANTIHTKRATLLATACTLSESTLKKYQEKVVEVVGEERAKEVKDAVSKETLHQNPLQQNEVIIIERGSSLCYESISGRYFKTDISQIEKAVNTINKEMLDSMHVSLNDFYYEIGLANTQIGDQIGWTVHDGLLDVYFSAQITDDGQPCLVMNYNYPPAYDFNKIY